MIQFADCCLTRSIKAHPLKGINLGSQQSQSVILFNKGTHYQKLARNQTSKMAAFYKLPSPIRNRSCRDKGDNMNWFNVFMLQNLILKKSSSKPS